MHKFNTAAEREAAIAAGQVSRRNSTLQDGHKHYAIVRYFHDGGFEIARNLTGTDDDDLDAANALARTRYFGPHAPGVAGYGAERIA